MKTISIHFWLVKVFTVCVLLTCTLYTQAQMFKTDTLQQDKRVKKGVEFRLDYFYLLSGSAYMAYEQNISQESSMGLVVNIPFSYQTWIYERLSVRPYYRRYFGKPLNRGFYGETFAAYGIYRDFIVKNNSQYDTRRNVHSFVVGFGLGYKLMSHKGLMVDFNLGIGRQFRQFNSYELSEIMTTGGISFGYRF